METSISTKFYFLHQADPLAVEHKVFKLTFKVFSADMVFIVWQPVFNRLGPGTILFLICGVFFRGRVFFKTKRGGRLRVLSVLYDTFLFCLGLVVLSWACDVLVKKAGVVGKRFRISPFVMGVVLLGMGTSAPEWAVSSLAAFQGFSDLAVGNVMGSNMFNTLIVLSVIIFSVSSSQSVRLPLWDSVFLFLASLVLLPLCYDLWLFRGEAFVLLVLFVVYMIFSIKRSSLQGSSFSSGLSSAQGQFSSPVLSFPRKRESTSLPTKKWIVFIDFLSQFKNSLWGVGGIIFLAFVFLAFGSHLTIKGAVGVGHVMGLSERVIGVLMVSVGTSLPELVVSLMAIRMSEKTMALGNVIGSNIFNTFAILGTAGLIQPLKVQAQVLSLDLVALLVAYFMLFLVFGVPFLSDFRRKGGWQRFFYCLKWMERGRVFIPPLFLLGYGMYISYLFFIMITMS